MKIVIQCAGTKNPTAPNSGLRSTDGRLVKFVSQPKDAPPTHDYLYARPDDLADDAGIWRDRIVEYNRHRDNPLGLLPAYRLYRHKAYNDLVSAFGKNKVFILTAGWGIVSADFLLPHYDITFSRARNVPSYARRHKADRYADFCMLPDDNEDIVFLGGKDYLSLFFELSRTLRAKKIVFINSRRSPIAPPGFVFERFDTIQRTNWHYSCAKALIGGQNRPGFPAKQWTP